MKKLLNRLAGYRRDYFAAHALTGIIAAHTPIHPDKATSPTQTADMYEAFAVTSYEIADAMLKERKTYA